MSAASIASLVFFVFAAIAASAVEFLLHSVAEQAGVNRWVFTMVPALFAMLYAMVVFQQGERKVRRVGESVSRGILVMLFTWISFAGTISWLWCPREDFLSCLSHTLILSGVIGGGPMLFSALGAGVLTGVLIIRRPRPRIE